MSSAELTPESGVARRLWRAPARRALLLMVFVAAAGYALYVGLNLDSRIGASRTPIPGQRTVELAAQKYDIYYEPTGEYNLHETFYAPSDLQIRIAPPGGRALPLQSYGGSIYVGSTGSQGVAVDTVQVPRSGRYVISTVGAIGPEAGTVVLGIPQGTAIIRLVIAGLLALAAFAALVNPNNSFWGWLGFGPGSGATLLSLLRRPWRLLGFGLDPGPAPSAFGTVSPTARDTYEVGPQVAPQAVPAAKPLRSARPAPSADPLDKLAMLADLRDRGVLTGEEFDAQKVRILGVLASHTPEPKPGDLMVPDTE